MASSAYDNYASIYNLVFGLPLRRSRRIAFALAELSSSDQVLEVGVGTGLSLPLYPDGIAVELTDYSEPMLAQARDAARPLNRKSNQFNFHHCDAAALPWEEGSFSCVIGLHFLSATADPFRSLRELSRVTQVGGRIVLVNGFTDIPSAKYWAWPAECAGRVFGFELKWSLQHLLSLERDLRLERQMVPYPGLPILAIVLRKVDLKKTEDQNPD